MNIYSHAGTHMDAPVHFGVGSQTIDLIAAERFTGKAWIINVNVTHERQLVTERDFEKMADKIKVGDSVIIKTGWCQFINEDKYRNGLPRISESLAHWLVAKMINRLVVEAPSVADVHDLAEVTLIHQILFKGDVIIIEGICNTKELVSESVELFTFPLKVRDGDGAPARVIAIQKN